MTHPLDGARLKIVRAQEHLDSLQAEIGIYLNEQPHEVFSRPQTYPYDSRRGASHAAYYSASIQHVLPPLTPGVPPLRLSTIIGDCITNARAALDYIVWELAQRYFFPVFDITKFSDRRIVSFPIHKIGTDTEKGFNPRIHVLTKRQIPAGAINQIEMMQPDNAGYEPLWWLHELVNTDKHRMPLLTIGQFKAMTVTFSTPAIFFDLTKEPSTLTIPRDTATQQPPMQSDVQMKGKVSIYVAWKDVPVPPEPVDRTLEQIVKTVADVIPRFDGFF